MFTGIIQEKGKVVNFSKGVLEISTNLDLSDCKIGSSICCNGVCLTATEIQLIDNFYQFKTNVGEETMFRTTFSENLFNKIKPINLEKSLKIGDEISGHFVYGHVDRTTKLLKVSKLNNSWDFFFENFQNKDKNYIVEKASIAVNGISLTIANVTNEYFSISVIPHTFDNTNLSDLQEYDIVNIEFDYLARFSERK
jgi:riboflavin synthase